MTSSLNPLSRSAPLDVQKFNIFKTIVIGNALVERTFANGDLVFCRGLPPNSSSIVRASMPNTHDMLSHVQLNELFEHEKHYSVLNNVTSWKFVGVFIGKESNHIQVKVYGTVNDVQYTSSKDICDLYYCFSLSVIQSSIEKKNKIESEIENLEKEKVAAGTDDEKALIEAKIEKLRKEGGDLSIYCYKVFVTTKLPTYNETSKLLRSTQSANREDKIKNFVEQLRVQQSNEIFFERIGHCDSRSVYVEV